MNRLNFKVIEIHIKLVSFEWLEVKLLAIRVMFLVQAETTQQFNAFPICEPIEGHQSNRARKNVAR